MPAVKKASRSKPPPRSTAARAPRSGKNHYHFFFEHMHEGFFRSVSEDHFTEVNPALVRMLGYRSSEEVLALSLARDVYADHTEGEQVRAQFESSGVINGKKVQWRKKNGERCTVSLYARAVKNARGRALEREGMVVDLTAQKQAEVELEQGREIFQRFIESSPACAYLKDENGRYVYINKAGEQLWPNALGKTDVNLFPVAIAKELREHDMMALASGSVSKFDEATEEADGVRYWTSFKFPIVCSSGKKFLASLCLDVTKQRQLEEHLRKSEERYRTISEMTSDYAYAFRVESGDKLNLEWITSTFSCLSGLRQEEMMEQGEGG